MPAAFGQRPQGGGGNGSISGTVTSSLDGSPIEFATITVFSQRDSSMVTGGITDLEGKFKLEPVQFGRYFVQISFIGFEKKTIEPVNVNPREGVKVKLGEIQLDAIVEALEAAEVVGKKQFMELMMDKRIYNVSENLGVTGGSAADVLETLPSIEVDADGTVSLRGNENVNVLIDGKPSALAGDLEAILEQIPASSIEKVEVITNPSAKYDADGTTGIINIVLKKSKLSGFHGNVSASASFGNQYNGSLALNYRTNKINVFANYGYRYADVYRRSSTDRTTFRPNDNLLLEQTEEGMRLRESHNIKTGLEWFVSETSVFNVSSTISFGQNQSDENLLNNQFFASGAPLRFYERTGIELGDNFGYDLSAGWRTEIDGNTDHVISADVQFGQSNRDRNNDIVNRDLDPLGEPLNGVEEIERNEITRFNETFNIQADYVRPIHDGKGKIETGFKSTTRGIQNGFFGEQLDLDTELFIEQINRNNDFNFTESVNALYASYGRQIERFSFQGGLRAEQVFSRSELITTDEEFRNDYFSLFPSAFVTYSLNDKSDVNVSYSRSINRPSAWQLNPFPSFRDELNIFRGNPFLLPEYINAMEAAYSLRTKRTVWMVSVYMQDASDVARRFNRVDENGVTNGTWENLDRMQSYGLELVANTELTKWWSFNLSGNAYRRDNNGSNLQDGLSNTAYSWSLRGMSTMKFDKGWNIQLSGFYRAPEEFVQGRFSGFWYTDIAIRKSVLKQKGSITVNLRDMFDTREFTFNIIDPAFEQERYRKRQSRFLFFTFTYKFGKLEAGKDRRSGRGRGSGGGGGGDFDGMDMD